MYISHSKIDIHIVFAQYTSSYSYHSCTHIQFRHMIYISTMKFRKKAMFCLPLRRVTFCSMLFFVLAWSPKSWVKIPVLQVLAHILETANLTNLFFGNWRLPTTKSALPFMTTGDETSLGTCLSLGCRDFGGCQWQGIKPCLIREQQISPLFFSIWSLIETQRWTTPVGKISGPGQKKAGNL